MTNAEILRTVDEVIASGPYSADWQSLCDYKTPKWYEDAKFGIFIHWGVYSVPSFEDEWYPRSMYAIGSAPYEHHRKTYGDQKDFGYKDFIPMFKGEKFDAAQWMGLFKKAGAKYVMPVAEHHDGFAMYDSELSVWNARRMGPCRDVIGELKQAADKEGIVFTVSNHRAEHCWYFNCGMSYDSDVSDPANEGFYWKQEGVGTAAKDIYSENPSKEHCEDWLARVCEMADKYRPQIVWFDWWINIDGFKPYLKKFAAYYYNRAIEWGVEVAINYKHNAYAYGTAIFDVERGQLAGIRSPLWQTDTAIGRKSWGYTADNVYKDAQELTRELVDVVSKNGCLLLNVGPRADGSITDEDSNVLLAIGQWLNVNGEGIYGAKPWEAFGEGSTNAKKGSFTDGAAIEYTTEDFRFTYKDGVIYAFCMKYPESGELTIKTFAKSHTNIGGFAIKDISILGWNAAVTYRRDEEGLYIRAGANIITEYPVCLKIALG